MDFRDSLLYLTHFNGTVLMGHVNNEARFIILCGENTSALPPSRGSSTKNTQRHAVTKTHTVLGWQTVIDNPPPSPLYSTILYYRSDALKHLFIYIHIWRLCKDKKAITYSLLRISGLWWTQLICWSWLVLFVQLPLLSFPGPEHGLSQ